MIDRILISDDIGQTRIALLEGPKLTELHILSDDQSDRVGNLYLGKVERVMTGLNAAFVAIGEQRAAFLRASDAQALLPIGKRDGSPKPIQNCVAEGQSILVAMTKEGTEGKGPRVTADPTLAGQYMVLTPLSKKVSISRKIEDVSRRNELHAAANLLAKDMDCGLIVRTAAADASADELAADATALGALWEKLQQDMKSKKAPVCLKGESGGIASFLQEFATSEITSIETDSAEMLALVRQNSGRVSADNISQLRGNKSLFDAHGIEDAIDEAVLREVPLPGGGSISIDHTEAMTVIDVNSGPVIDRGSYEAMAHQTNLSAIETIAHQIRLRGIGGLIVIDLVQMNEPGHVKDVEKALAAATKDDPAAIALAPMSRFGLIEMTRQRLRDPLGIAGSEACHHCAGVGRVRSMREIGLGLMRLVARKALTKPGAALKLTVSDELGDWFRGDGKTLTDEFSRRYASVLEIRTEPSFDREKHIIG